MSLSQVWFLSSWQSEQMSLGKLWEILLLLKLRQLSFGMEIISTQIVIGWVLYFDLNEITYILYLFYFILYVNGLIVLGTCLVFWAQESNGIAFTLRPQNTAFSNAEVRLLGKTASPVSSVNQFLWLTALLNFSCCNGSGKNRQVWIFNFIEQLNGFWAQLSNG